jgi:hypothetical protein
MEVKFRVVLRTIFLSRHTFTIMIARFISHLRVLPHISTTIHYHGYSKPVTRLGFNCFSSAITLSNIWKPSLINCTNDTPSKRHIYNFQVRCVSTKQRRKWKVRKYHFKLRLKRTMRKMRVPYVSSKSRGQVKKKPILYDFRPYLRRKLKRAER